ncbi:MAG: hypothetical protein OEW19_09050 [Acidobacteriota bacterium]|nr:hypothetical protein [Acidobacteriota bacterium]
MDLRVDTEEAYDMTRRLARQEGVLVGGSAAANVLAATRVASAPTVAVTMLRDGGERHLSDRFWAAT